MKGWTCQRTTNGQRCGQLNPSRFQVCRLCGKRKPPRKRPAHLRALELPYEEYVRINGGEVCGICGRSPKDGKKLHRDHDHRSGAPRGTLCFPCNQALRSYMTEEWLEAALEYLRRQSADVESSVGDG